MIQSVWLLHVCDQYERIGGSFDPARLFVLLWNLSNQTSSLQTASLSPMPHISSMYSHTQLELQSRKKSRSRTSMFLLRPPAWLEHDWRAEGKCVSEGGKVSEQRFLLFYCFRVKELLVTLLSEIPEDIPDVQSSRKAGGENMQQEINEHLKFKDDVRHESGRLNIQTEFKKTVHQFFYVVFTHPNTWAGFYLGSEELQTTEWEQKLYSGDVMLYCSVSCCSHSHKHSYQWVTFWSFGSFVASCWLKWASDVSEG